MVHSAIQLAHRAVEVFNRDLASPIGEIDSDAGAASVAVSL